MKFLLVPDTHLSDTPPSIRTDSYAEDVLAKLRFAQKQAENHQVAAILHGGDIFHRKSPAKNSHALVQATWAALTDDGKSQIPVRVVPGNHDLMHDRMESLSQQPLGSLLKMIGIDLLLEEDDPDCPVAFGIPYLQNFTEELPQWMEKWRASKAKLLVAHAPLFPSSEEPPYEYICAKDWADLMGNEGSCFYSHIHDPHGVYVEAGVRFCNNGGLSRGSLHEKTLARVPKITLWDSVSDIFTPIEVPCRPASEVFRLDEKAAEDQATAKLDEFLGSVEATTLDGLSLEEVVHKAESMDLKPLTLQVVKDSIEHALAARG